MRLAGLVLMLGACATPDTMLCANGGVCPEGLKCVALGDRDVCVQLACGNGISNENEFCDDGNNESGDGCSASCGEPCGDGIVDQGEACDDGNRVSSDGCSANCLSTERCGNAVVDPGEACDDGNLRSHDDCSSRCTIETLAWTAVGKGPLVRSTYALAYDEHRATIVLFGGVGDNPNGLGETWEWNGHWRERATTDGPLYRANPGLVFDSQRGRVVLFGGGGGDFQDTWEWDGSQWHATVAEGPALDSPALAYDRARQRVVMFGGISAGTPSTQTWEREWDGTAWIERTPSTGGPPPLANHAMAYDERRNRVMFGGYVYEPTAGTTSDTWEWDGTSWRKLGAVGPSARFDAVLAPDPRGGLVLFGGVEDFERSVMRRDTWILRADDPAVPDESCLQGLDSDGDGKVACDDPDCRCS